MEFKHISVLLEESINALEINQNGIYVDGTLGGAGHSSWILSQNSTARVIGIDRDSDALAAAQERMKDYRDRFIAVKSNFKDVLEVLEKLGIKKVDGALLDLGVSSYQFDKGERGFSYNFDAALDMRMDQSEDFSAYDIVNTYPLNELTYVIKDYGEERYARNIARKIVEARKTKQVETTFELVDIIKSAMPAAAKREAGHPAKRTFQAIRIEVNAELRILKNALYDFFEVLKPGGRLAVISFHSLEDRIVKNAFKDFCRGCTCPRDFPVCVCGSKPKGRLVFKKPVMASQQELSENKRASSAKLRVVEKL